MHYRDITEKALEMGWISTSGKTPAATMNAQLVTEIKQAKTSGEPGRFIRTSPGHYSLIEWNGRGLPSQIQKHNNDIRKRLLVEIMNLSPKEF